MAHVIMDHRVSRCFGTSLAPTMDSEQIAGLANEKLPN